MHCKNCLSILFIEFIVCVHAHTHRGEGDLMVGSIENEISKVQILIVYFT